MVKKLLQNAYRNKMVKNVFFFLKNGYRTKNLNCKTKQTVTPNKKYLKFSFHESFPPKLKDNLQNI